VFTLPWSEEMLLAAECVTETERGSGTDRKYASYRPTDQSASTATYSSKLTYVRWQFNNTAFAATCSRSPDFEKPPSYLAACSVGRQHQIRRTELRIDLMNSIAYYLPFIDSRVRIEKSDGPWYLLI
jgi:hypothetical protein